MIKMNKLKLIVVLGFFATVHAGKFISGSTVFRVILKKNLF